MLKPPSTLTSTPEPTTTPKPTFTPTPTSTPPDIPFKVEEGVILEWTPDGWVEVPLPEDGRRVTSVEEHNGSWFGIDEFGLAIAKMNSPGKWEIFSRPVVTVMHPDFDVNDIMNALGEEIPPDQILRLVDGSGEDIDNGFLFDTEHEFPNGNRYVAYVSSVIMGSITRKGNTYILMELPLSYQRVVVPVFFPGKNCALVYAVPTESKNIEERGGHSGLNYCANLIADFQNARGHQVVIGFLYKDEDPGSPGYIRTLEQFGEGLKSGELSENLWVSVNVPEVWVDDSVLQKFYLNYVY